MSMYVGSNGSQKVLHIYNDSPNIEKSNFSGTSFHSSLPYFRVDKVHRFTQNGTTPYQNYYYTSRGYSCNTIIDLKSNILCVGTIGNTKYFFPTSIGNLESSFPINTTFGGLFNQYSISFGLSSQSSGYVAISKTWGGNLVYDHIDLYQISFNPINISSNEVIVNNKDITVNGSSIFSNMFLMPLKTINDRVNDYDIIFPVPNNLVHVGFYYHQSYTRTVNNSEIITDGGYSLFQLIGSYNAPITGVELTPTSISVIKNGFHLKQFDAGKHFLTQVSNSVSSLIIAAGVRKNSQTINFLTSIAIPYAPGGKLIASMTAYSYIAYDSCIIDIVAGKKFPVFYSPKNNVFGIISNDLRSILFYWDLLDETNLENISYTVEFTFNVGFSAKILY
ncbi:MAG: hypothetical protein JHC33_10780 [Ignisphaera sp.]|nr:hypothetical protein [Ignisphaera sp.]